MPTSHPTAAGATERALLEAAQRGDESAYGLLVGPHRSALQAHCYRMLGSLHDAEDALQDALLRAWRGLAGFEGRSSFRAWLYRIATNVCLKAIARRPRRALPTGLGPPAGPGDGLGEPLAEPVWLEPFPDGALGPGLAAPEARYEQRESVELAFVAALQLLPARQRAVLILREVLGFSASEVAEVLETTPAAIDSALQRARRGVADRLPEQSQQAALRSLGDARLRELTQRFVDAWEHGDVDAILALLSDDASLAMPPRPTWYRGPAAIGSFLRSAPLSGRHRWRLVPMGASGQVAFGAYCWEEASESYAAHGVYVLGIRGAQIDEITVFLTPGLLARFPLPRSLAP